MTRCRFFAMSVAVSSIALAVAIALPGSGRAQTRTGVAAPAAPHAAAPVAPHAAAPAPHFSAPAAMAPRSVAPQFGTSHIATPQLAPRLAPSYAASPRFNSHGAGQGLTFRGAGPRIATPHGGTVAARQIGRPLARDLNRPGNRGTTFAHTPRLLGRAAQRHDRGALGFAQRLDSRRSIARSRHQDIGRALVPAGRDRLTGQTGLRNRGNNANNTIVAGRGFHGRVVHQDSHHDWKRFAGRDRDRARRRFHAGFVGWAGPVFWPYADYDIVDYTVWPYDYGDVFWSYGPEDIVETVLWPNAADESADESAEAPRGARSRRGRHRTSVARQDFTATCGGEQGIADWPVGQIERAVQPTDQQRAAFADLKAASVEASKIIRAACPRRLPATPAGRLAVMESRLEAMRSAVDIMRPALDKLYGQLSDDQKARFNALAAPQSDADKTALERACAEQASHVTQWPIDQIERTVRPTAAQRQSFDDLRAALTRAAEDLRASCPSELPATPPRRLDAVRQRIDAMRAAVAMIRDKLEGFYATLDDEQKARFNAIGTSGSES